MKKLITLFFISAFVFTANAQMVAEYYLRAEYAMWFAKSKSLSEFFSTYNSYQAAHPEAGGVSSFKEKPGTMSGFLFGVGARFFTGEHGYIDCSLSGGKFSSQANLFGFNNGDAREIKITSNDFLFGFGFGFGRRFCIGPDFNIAIQKARVASGYLFADGTRTYGADHNLNGIYTGGRAGLYYGIEASYRIIKYLRIAVGFGRYGTLLPADKFYFDESGGPKAESDNPYTYLPQNYDMYVTDPFSAADNTALNNLRGLRLNFGLRIQIPSGDNEK